MVNNPSAKNIDSVEMFNILGQSVFNVIVNNNNQTLITKVNKLTAGVYIINLKVDDKTISKKILIN